MFFSSLNSIFFKIKRHSNIQLVLICATTEHILQGSHFSELIFSTTLSQQFFLSKMDALAMVHQYQVLCRAKKLHLANAVLITNNDDPFR
jgi:hypothetical protein